MHASSQLQNHFHSSALLSPQGWKPQADFDLIPSTWKKNLISLELSQNCGLK